MSLTPEQRALCESLRQKADAAFLLVMVDVVERDSDSNWNHCLGRWPNRKAVAGGDDETSSVVALSHLLNHADAEQFQAFMNRAGGEIAKEQSAVALLGRIGLEDRALLKES